MIPETSVVMLDQKFSDSSHQDAFHFRRNSRRSRTGFVAALAVGDFGPDVAGRVIAVSSHRDEEIRAEFLSGQLILNEQFAGHVQDS